MLTMVEVYTAQGDVLALPLSDVSTGYVVKDISGLDPVKATLVSSPFASIDGVQFQSSRLDARNIVLKLGLEPYYGNTTIATLKQRLYSFFMTKSLVRFLFYEDGTPFVQIMGRVETCDIPKFAKEPEATISVMCFEPDFIAVNPVDLDGFSTSGTTAQPFVYEGSVPTGFVFSLRANRALSDFTIYTQPATNDLFTLGFSAPLLSGDIVEISTIPGNKYAALIRSGIRSPILYGVSPTANWMSLQPGVNNVRVFTTGAAIPWTIEYLPRYGGL
jgi:hypothetical protein